MVEVTSFPSTCIHPWETKTADSGKDWGFPFRITNSCGFTWVWSFSKFKKKSFKINIFFNIKYFCQNNGKLNENYNGNFNFNVKLKYLNLYVIFYYLILKNLKYIWTLIFEKKLNKLSFLLTLEILHYFN